MEFSEKVKFVRMKLYLSQMELSERVGQFRVQLLTGGKIKGNWPQLARLGKFNAFCEKNGISFNDSTELL